MTLWIAITLLLVVSSLALLSNLLLIPGNWIMTATAAIFVLTTDLDRGPTWTVVVICAVLAGLGEGLELLLGSARAAQKGASRRAMLLSLVFSIVGSLAGSFLIPIPVVGTAIGAIAGAGLGAFGGAWVGEAWIGSDSQKRLQVSNAAMAGRLLGMLAKVAVGAAILAVQIVSVLRTHG